MACHHFDHLKPVPGPSESYAKGCEECVKIGSQWVHLRECLICGHVGCCDSSPGRHARLHAYQIGHPIVQSYLPRADWRWCYFDETYV